MQFRFAGFIFIAIAVTTCLSEPGVCSAQSISARVQQAKQFVDAGVVAFERGDTAAELRHRGQVVPRRGGVMHHAVQQRGDVSPAGDGLFFDDAQGDFGDPASKDIGMLTGRSPVPRRIVGVGGGAKLIGGVSPTRSGSALSVDSHSIPAFIGNTRGIGV